MAFCVLGCCLGKKSNLTSSHWALENWDEHFWHFLTFHGINDDLNTKLINNEKSFAALSITQANLQCYFGKVSTIFWREIRMQENLKKGYFIVFLRWWSLTVTGSPFEVFLHGTSNVCVYLWVRCQYVAIALLFFNGIIIKGKNVLATLTQWILGKM